MKNTIQEPKQTITTQLSGMDALRFQNWCNEVQMSQSEAIQYLIKSIVSIPSQESASIKSSLSIQNMENIDTYRMQRETEMFYENFKRMDHKKPIFQNILSS
jgi:hypothetical protein